MTLRDPAIEDQARVAQTFTLYSWMTPFCMWLGGGSQEMVKVTLVLLLGFTTATVTALGGALGTESARPVAHGYTQAKKHEIAAAS